MFKVLYKHEITTKNTYYKKLVVDVVIIEKYIFVKHGK